MWLIRVSFLTSVLILQLPVLKDEGSISLSPYVHRYCIFKTMDIFWSRAFRNFYISSSEKGNWKLVILNHNCHSIMVEVAICLELQACLRAIHEHYNGLRSHGICRISHLQDHVWSCKLEKLHAFNMYGLEQCTVPLCIILECACTAMMTVS